MLRNKATLRNMGHVTFVYRNIAHVMVQSPIQARPSLNKSYQERRKRAYQRVEALGLKRRWVARQVGRSVRCVTEVLRGTDTGEPTLVLIEVLLRSIEAGDVEVTEEATARKRGGRR